MEVYADPHGLQVFDDSYVMPPEDQNGVWLLHYNYLNDDNMKHIVGACGKQHPYPTMYCGDQCRLYSFWLGAEGDL